MKKTKYPVMNMGTASILTIFIVLCMVTFATLSFISANKDAAFTRQIADRTTAYYAASNEANHQIAEYTEQVKQSWKNGTYDELPKTYTITVPIDEQKQLNVVLTLCNPDQTGGTYCRITEFKEISIEDWEGDEHLPVLQ
ncbi:hypothetical protein ABXS75_01970 [Roseburia hominis]